MSVVKDPFITTTWPEPRAVTIDDMLDAWRYAAEAWERHQYPLYTINTQPKEKPMSYIVLYRYDQGGDISLAAMRVEANSKVQASQIAAKVHWVGDIIAVSDIAPDDFDVFLYEVTTSDTPVYEVGSNREDRLTEVPA